MRPTDPTQQEPLDVPNTRCQPVPGNRGIATRCLDTIARSTTTTFVGQDRTYMIAMAGKAMDEHIYQHMLDSFAPDAPTAAGQTQTAHRSQNDLAPLLLQPGDLPDTITSQPADDPAPPNFANDPPATTIVGRRLTRDGRAAGSVSLLLYDNPSDLAQAYQRLTASTDPFTGQGNAMEPRTDVGDKAATMRLTLASSTYGPTHTVVVVAAGVALWMVRVSGVATGRARPVVSGVSTEAWGVGAVGRGAAAGAWFAAPGSATPQAARPSTSNQPTHRPARCTAH